MVDDTPPDAIYVNAKVVTVDPGFALAEAFAVKGHRFAAVGTSAEVRRLAVSGVPIMDLGGKVVLPGFIDTHAHTIHRGIGMAARPSLAGVHSVEEIVRRIGSVVEETPRDEWIVTSPIGDPPDYFSLPECLAEKRWPTRFDLDRVAPHNPVYIPTSAYWPHPAIFNSTALAILRITNDKQTDPMIRIDRDSIEGMPTGVIYGLNLYNRASALNARLLSLLPALPREVQYGAVRRAIEDNVAVGVTTIYEGHANFSLPLIREMRAAGELAGRIVSTYEVPGHLPLAELETWMQGLNDARGAGSGDDICRVLGITVSLDGPTQFGLALMNEPYLDPYGEKTTGASAVSLEKLTAVARLAAKHDLRLNICAAGDKACEIAVEALEAVDRDTPIRDKRWVAQHFQHPSRRGVAKLKNMGVVVQSYSSVDFSKGRETFDRFSPGIWKTVVPLRWWLDGGVVVAQSSDGAHYDPMFTLWESLVRVDGRTGKSLLTADKKITRQEAIQIYTINGAFLLQVEDRLGSIEPGKLADFVVLDEDILTCQVDQIRGSKVLVTAVGGKVLHDPTRIAH